MKRTALVANALLWSLAGCIRSQPAHPIRIRRIAPIRVFNYTDTPVTIMGSGFASLVSSECSLPCPIKLKKKGGIRFEMWQGSSERLKKGFSLLEPKVLSDTRLRALVPAGVPTGWPCASPG